MNKKSNIIGVDDVQEVNFTFAKATEELNLESRIDVREKPTGFSIMQIFPLDILYHLITNCMKYFMFDQAKNIPTNIWIPRWRSRLDMFDVRSLLGIDCSAFGVKIKVSNFLHESVGCGLLLARLFDAEETVGYLYGKIVYLNLMTQKQIRKTYCDGVRFDSVCDFSSWVFKVLETFLNRTGKETRAWIESARFSCIEFIKDSRHLPGDNSRKIQRRTQPRGNNESFV